MKLIHAILAPASGGAETYVMDLAKEQQKRGYQIEIVFIFSANDIGRDGEYEKKYLGELESHNINYTFLGGMTRYIPLIGFWKFKRIVDKLKPDIIHCHTNRAAVYCLPFVSVTKIFTQHNHKITQPKIFFFLLQKAFQGIVSISEACTTSLSAHVRSEPYRIDNGVSKKRINISKQAEKNTICMIGSLIEQKNYQLAIDAMEALKKSEFVLKIAGEGNLRTELEYYVQKKNLEKKVVFLGNVVDINDVLSKSKIILNTSKWEGLSISLIEATHAGLCLVVADVGGSKEIIQRCKNGYVFPEGDLETLKTILTKLAADHNLLKKFRKNSLKNRGYYEISRAVNEHHAMYLNLIQE